MLVKDKSKRDPLWKLPCGGIEPKDEGVVAAAIREVFEETGIELSPGQVNVLEEQRRENGTYYPYFCVANISEAELDTRKKIGDEDGKPLMVADFYRDEIPTMLDLLERHRQFVQNVEGPPPLPG